MAGSITLPRADRRTPYVRTIRFNGFDFTGATFTMHIRQFPGDTGTPLVSLTNATAGTQGFSFAVATVLGIPETVLTIQIDKATLEALPSAAPTNKTLSLAYDLHITPSGGIKQVWLEGAFNVSPGVTI